MYHDEERFFSVVSQLVSFVSVALVTGYSRERCDEEEIDAALLPNILARWGGEGL